MRRYPDLLFKKNRPVGIIGGSVSLWSIRKVKTTRYELAEDASFEYFGEMVVMEEGFQSDFASIPRLLWTFIPPHGLGAIPSVKHDWIYDNRYGQEIYGAYGARLLADLTFLLDCLAEGMPETQAYLMFHAIRTFGEPFWRN